MYAVMLNAFPRPTPPTIPGEALALRLGQVTKLADGASGLPTLGRVCQVVGNLVESTGLQVSLGESCVLQVGPGQEVMAEVVGFRDQRVLLMPMDNMAGIAMGNPVRRASSKFKPGFSQQYLGRVLDGLGQPLDGRPLPAPESFLSLEAPPPNALERLPIERVFETGVRAIDGLLTMGQGQRVGLFAGSGVGKSTLLGMIARGSSASVNVIALIGERGREVREFLEKALGPEGLARSVVVAATSDQSPLVRIRASKLATAMAEAFREQGKEVLLLMDSVTRIALAQREIGLAVGEPPTTRGYTPSVFTMLPKLLERSGNSARGSMTAIYTVLVEGDDMNEPIADAVRGILDGHFVLSRRKAQQNHYPALDVLASVSRLMNDVADGEHRLRASKMRELLATYEESLDLVNLGAYTPGNSPLIDEAIAQKPQLDAFLRQDLRERVAYSDTLDFQRRILE